MLFETNLRKSRSSKYGHVGSHSIENFKEKNFADMIFFSERRIFQLLTRFAGILRRISQDTLLGAS